MRSILFLLIAGLFNCNLAAQDGTTKRPTQKEMQAQMLEAGNEARQQVNDLKKQIAEAKLNKEDPGTIQEMEKQLATMEQMVALIEKTSTLSNAKTKSLPPPTTVEPKYVSPFIPITLKQPVPTPTNEQAKDQLLWYTGRRIDVNTLIMSTGMIVRYDRANNRVIVQPDRRADSTYYGLLNALAQITQMKNDFAAGMNAINNSFFMYPEIKKAYDEFTGFREVYYDIAKNTTDLPSQSVGNPTEILHHQLLAYMANLPSPRNIQLPPERSNDLCYCDEEERRQYKTKLKLWMPRFFHEENGLLNLIQAIYLSITGGAIQANAQTPMVPNLHTDIITAFNLIIERSTQKLEELSNRYQPSNAAIEDGLVMATKAFQKKLFNEFQHTGAQSTAVLRRNAHATIHQIRELVLNNTVFEKYVDEQKAALNFNAVLDYSLYVSHEMNKKILKVSHNVDDNVSAWYDKLEKFNRFALSLKLDFEYEQFDPATEEVLIKANGKLQSDYIIVSLARDECDWHLFVTEANHRDRSGNEEEFQIPFRVESGLKTIYEMRDGVRVPRILPYSGPAKMNMVFPAFKINLCPNGGNDKASMQVLRYSDAALSAHPKPDFAREYTLDMLQYVNKMLLSYKKGQRNAADLTRISVDMMNIQGITPYPPSTGNQTLDKILMNYRVDQKKRELQTSLNPTSHTGSTEIPFDAKNRSSVLISKTHSTVDPADQDFEFGVRLTRGLITMEVTHSPLQ